MSVPLVMSMKARGTGGPQVPILRPYKYVVVEGLTFGDRARVFFDFEMALETFIDGVYEIKPPVPSKAHATLIGSGASEVSVWLE